MLLRHEVLGPLEAAMYDWFDASTKFGDGEDNPYWQFRDCYDLAAQLKLNTIQLIRFNSGKISALEFDGDLNVDQLMAELDA